MIDDTNPAGRLYTLLRTASSKSERSKTREVWASVLGCDSKDSAELTRGVVEIYNLTQEVQKLIRLIPDLNHDLYLSSFHNIYKGFFPLQLDNNWQQYKNALNDEVLTRLQFCADELGKHYAEENLDTEELSEIESLLDDAFRIVESSSIEAALRIAILEEFERIRSAIRMYRIRGAKGVKEGLQSLLGSVIVNRESLLELRKEHGNILGQISSLIDKLDSFTSRVFKVNRILSGPVGKALAFLAGAATDA